MGEGIEIAIGGPFPLFAWLALFVALCSYHAYLYWKLTKLPPNEAPLVATVEKQLKEVDNFVKMYYSFAPIVGLIFFMVSIAHVFTFVQGNLLLLIPQIFSSFFSGLGAFFAMRWYTNKLYGQHHTTLLQCHKTLQSA